MIFTAHQRGSGEVMFSAVSGCHSVHRSSTWPLPMIYWTSPYRDNPLVPVPSPPPCTGLPWSPPRNIWCPTLEIYSNLFTWGLPHSVVLTSGGYWSIIWSSRRQYALYWNAVLFFEHFLLCILLRNSPTFRNMLLKQRYFEFAGFWNYCYLHRHCHSVRICWKTLRKCRSFQCYPVSASPQQHDTIRSMILNISWL